MGATRTTVPLLLWGALELSAGCSLVTEADGPNCTTETACSRVNGEARLCDQGRCVPKTAVPWGCVVEPKLDANGSVTLDVTVVEQVGMEQLPLADATVLMCTVGDPFCADAEVFVTDGEGRFRTNTRRSFARYLEIAHPSPAYAPRIVQAGPFQNKREARLIVRVVLKPWSEVLSGEASPELNQGRSHLQVRLAGCPSWTGAGAELEFAMPSTDFEGPVYSAAGNPAESAGRTDDSGLAWFVNIDSPAGSVDRAFAPILAREADTGIPLAQTFAALRKGWVSELLLDPLRNPPSR